ncbi:hypothetical protein FG379_001534 [Cryptosporidium bovis]|uniref:uncharacterized protein n=1 Tax=Cryptosporidium bovis TaxID=310047 RepID=UPI00351A24B9|nr:hypothetical protein FG379_001534 [Cryptosporidium bovis]
MSPLRGRKIRRIYINSDNCNEGASNRINNLDLEFDSNYGLYDENFRYNHFRKLSKVAAALNIPHHVQANHGIAPLDDASFSNGGIHIKATPAHRCSENRDNIHTNRELRENNAFNIGNVREEDTLIHFNTTNTGAIQTCNPNNAGYFDDTNNGIVVGDDPNTYTRDSNCSGSNNRSAGININNICSSNIIGSDLQENNCYIKSLTPMQIRYLQRTQKLLSYELPQYKSGIKQLLSLPEYLPCDM